MARPALGTLGTVPPAPLGWRRAGVGERSHREKSGQPPATAQTGATPGECTLTGQPRRGWAPGGGREWQQVWVAPLQDSANSAAGLGGGRCNIQGGEPTAAEAGSPEPRSPLAFPAIPEPRAPHHCGGNAPGSSKSPATCGPLPTPPRALPAHPRRDVEGEGRGGGRARGGVGRNWEVEISCRQPAQPDLPPGPILQVDCADPTDLPLNSFTPC